MQTHRKYLVVTIWISTIAFVGAGFVGWGAYSFSADKANAVAKVGERSISGKELQSSYNNIYGYYNQMMGGKLTQEKADQLKLQDIAFEQLIKETLLLNYADELGITALEKEIVSQIHSIDNFKANGKFDKETYFKVLKAVNKEAQEFEDGIKKEIIIKKLSSALQIPFTELELETLAASLYIQDQLNTKLIDVQNSDINMSDDALKSFWENTKNDYMSEKSYTVETIKVSSNNIEVKDAEVEEFYNEKKHLFKGDDDKILGFEDVKEDVTKKVQLKKAKKEALKKYLAFKDGKIEADESKTVSASKSDIPLEKIVIAKAGSFIKAIELPDGYITAKLTSINMPEPLAYEAAKPMAQNNYLKTQKTQLLEQRAKASLESLEETQALGFLTRDDAAKVTSLSENEARVFLGHVFSKSDKKGYYIFADKAVVYEITDQKLLSPEQLEANKENLIKNIESIKNNTTQNMLIKQLEKKYKIEKYYKG